MSDTETGFQENTVVSTGAGIAIAGVWLASAAVTITILLIAFVFAPIPDSEAQKISEWQAFGIILLLASPMIAAYSITKVIISKD